MPKRVIDFDALWASDKIAGCPGWAQAEYAWLYGLADASGCFELTNLRVIWGRVAAVRKDLTIERLEEIFQEFRARGLLFTWEAGGKLYGHWTGSDVPGRLPPPSWRARLERLAPPLPRAELAAYMSRFASRRPEWRAAEFGESAADAATHETATADPRGATAATESECATTQVKPGLEAPQAQEWSRDWKEEKESTDTPERVPLHRISETVKEQRERRASSGQPSHTAADEFFAVYERERGALPAAAILTPERRKQCALRIRAGLSSEKFGAAVRRAAATPFLTGGGTNGWRASFDWLIANDTNVHKVLEGAYERGETRAHAGDTHGGGFAASARDRALYSELHVGAGPVAADYGVRVRPEVLERIRAREAGLGRSGAVARRPP